MTNYSPKSISQFPAIPLLLILGCMVVPAIVIQLPWYVLVALPFGLAGWVYLVSRPALALAIQCCGFYIALFVLDILGISTSTLITAGFHVTLASCYLTGVARTKFFFKSLFHPTTVFFGFMIFWFGTNWYLYSRGSELGITKIGFMLTMMLPVFIGIHLFDLEQFEKFRSYSIILGFIGLALAATSMFILGISTDEFGRFRVTPSANPLAFAYPLGISTLFMFSLALEKDAKYRLAAALMMAGSLFFILSTGSRGPILALFASMIVLLWWAGIRRWLRFVPISIIAILVIGAALFPFIPESALDRIYSVANFLNDGSLANVNAIFTDRLRLWQLSLNLWLRHPWTGIGLGNMGSYYIGNQSFAHNFIFELLSETGGIGFSIFVVNMIGAVVAVFQLYKIKDQVSAAASIIALAIFSLFNISVSGQITSAIPLWIAYGGLIRLSILGKQLKPAKTSNASDNKDIHKSAREASKIIAYKSGLWQRDSNPDQNSNQVKPNVEANINSTVAIGKHFTTLETPQSNTTGRGKRIG